MTITDILTRIRLQKEIWRYQFQIDNLAKRIGDKYRVEQEITQKELNKLQKQLDRLRK